MGEKFDITKPLWDQNSFTGRFRHFAFITNPLLNLASEKELFEAKDLYNRIKETKSLEGTTKEKAIRAKQLYESAFHPDSGDLQNVCGRMSFQMPGGCLITGAMLQWYKSNTAIIFWQWINQSFNAVVNMTNRNANSPLTTAQMGVAYVSATSAALITALTFKFVVQKRTKNPIMARFVPFVAVAAANCVNIPLMRQTEFINGIDVRDSNGAVVGKSQVAPAKGIAQVISSRVTMAAPGMLLLPFIMEKLERKPWMQKIQWAHAGIQTAIVGCFLLVMVPTACALYPQQCKLSTNTMKKFEVQNYEELVRNTNGNPPEFVYFNKGL